MRETHQVEYKQVLTDGLEKEVVAFLNYGSGGKIVLGIDKHQNIVGLQDVDSDALKIKDRLKHNISPSILGLFDIQISQQEGKDLITIIVAGGPEKPYFISKYGMTHKGCFLRVGTAAEPMTQDMIDKLFAARTRNSLSKIKSEKQSLTFSQLRIYYDEQGKTLNDQFAHNLELLTEEGSYNYNGYLLSDVNVTSFKLAKFEGTDRSKLSGTEDFGNTCIVTAAKKLLDRLDVENKTQSRIDGDRHDKRLWNQEALREAVRNAFVHNDYSRETFPKFEIFSDRIEITSAGGLPSGLSEEEFFSGYSAPRNKVLMRIFRDVGLVESLGIGIPKILETYDRDCFVFTDNYLRMSFPKIDGGRTGGRTGGKTGGKSPANVVGFEQLTPKQKELLEILISDNSITYDRMAEAMNVRSTTAVQKHMDGLKKAGAVSRDQDFGGTWIINYKHA